MIQNHTCNFKPDEYESIRRLGRGSYGIINEMLHQPTSKIVARKTFLRLRNGRSHPQYRQERKILQSLRDFPHQHIIQLMDYWADKNKDSIILFPVASGDLQGFMTGFDRKVDTKSSLKDFLLLRWIRCLSLAVEFLHLHGIIHNDIKPANVLIHGRNVLITDFGNAWLEKEGPNNHNYYAYTPRYCAPEVASRGVVGPSADIFSLGCVYTEVATILSQ